MNICYPLLYFYIKNLSQELDENTKIVRAYQEVLSQDVEGVRSQLTKADTTAATNLTVRYIRLQLIRG